MRVVITGAKGFIGQNLAVRLALMPQIEVIGLDSSHTPGELNKALAKADVLVHLAGVNRPQDPGDFARVNTAFTQHLCTELTAQNKSIPIIFASSSQALLANSYGKSKRAAETILESHANQLGLGLAIFRLPGVFGKWAKPNYNSVVATFCSNAARGLPLEIHDKNSPLELVYIDDVIDAFIALLIKPPSSVQFPVVSPQYSLTVGELASTILSFASARQNYATERVGSGLLRALYATYVSYLPPSDFSQSLAVHADPRGRFVEILKTPDSGQFSFFTAHPGMTRGGHFHHTKTEKFVVVQGLARFRFRQLISGEEVTIQVDSKTPQMIESIPGWTHDITNIGDSELIVLLWSSETFNPKLPDTTAMPLE